MPADQGNLAGLQMVALLYVPGVERCQSFIVVGSSLSSMKAVSNVSPKLSGSMVFDYSIMLQEYIMQTFDFFSVALFKVGTSMTVQT